MEKMEDPDMITCRHAHINFGKGDKICNGENVAS
jgi:cytochrome P450